MIERQLNRTYPERDRAIAHALGLDNLLRDLDAVLKADTQLVHESLAASGRTGPIQLHDTHIHLGINPPAVNTSVLCFDIGGTHTRAALRRVDQSGAVAWRPIFDQQNDVFDHGKQPLALDRFTVNLFDLLTRGPDLPNHFDGVAVVWSNPVENYQVIGGETGIGARVHIPPHGHKKGEFFLEGLNSGFDLTPHFVEATHAVGIKIDHIIINNDIGLVLKAMPEASGAVIASTGANASLCRDGKIFNPELAISLTIDQKYLARSEQMHDALDYMALCSGTGLSNRMAEAILFLNSAGETRLPSKFIESIASGQTRLTSADLTRLIYRDFNGFREQHSLDPRDVNDQTCQTLRAVALGLESRAAVVAAALASHSVADKPRSKVEPAVVVLDSALAKYYPNFYREVTQHLLDISNGSIVALAPRTTDPVLTLPIIGGAHALDELIG